MVTVFNISKDHNFINAAEFLGMSLHDIHDIVFGEVFKARFKDYIKNVSSYICRIENLKEVDLFYNYRALIFADYVEFSISIYHAEKCVSIYFITEISKNEKSNKH
jgi:hypothetical protein